MPENTNPQSGNHSGNQPGGQQKPTLSWSQPTAKPAAAASATPVPPLKNTPNGTVAATANTGSNMGVYVGIFVAGLIIGALIGWGITSSRSGESSTTATSTGMVASSSSSATANGNASKNAATPGQSSPAQTGSASSAHTASGNGNIILAATQPAGFAVAVSRFSVSQPTWLVVYEDHSGTPGNAIGAGLFFPGQTSGTVELLRATLPGQSYFVGESLDDGDKIFSLASDKPVRDAQGNPLFTEFKAQ